MRAGLIIFALASATAAGAGAQDVTAVPQITGAEATDTSPAQVGQQVGELPPQLSAQGDGAPRQQQLTSAGQSDEGTSQVSTAPRNAQPPHPRSTPEEGRTAAVARVEGKDRCDPASPKDKKSAECKHVIETRSAEFAKPSPSELSPEQKLLIDQQLLAREGDLSSATRRLANSGDTDNDIAAMGVASVVLARNQPETKNPEQDPQTDAAIQAFIGALTQPPQ
jgi:hypothetical protein